jgi:hypothetical protein
MVKTVTLKRTVTIKAIVTEDFKKYLKYELDTAIKDVEKKVDDIGNQAKQLVETLNKEGANDQIQSIEQQLKLEKQQQANVVNDLKNRIKEAEGLEIGSEFVQGTIDGFVGVKPGDNLYQKLGALEIVVKDGVVQELKGEGDA